MRKLSVGMMKEQIDLDVVASCKYALAFSASTFSFEGFSSSEEVLEYLRSVVNGADPEYLATGITVGHDTTGVPNSVRRESARRGGGVKATWNGANVLSGLEGN